MMAHLILPKQDLDRLIRHRRRAGADRRDEVWGGVYVMSPEADNQHQELVGLLTAALIAATAPKGSRVLPGANVSNHRERWTRNYRCPDIAVFLPGNPAEDRGSHWFGGPDLAIEIVSPKDRSRQKLGFYAKVRTRELLIVERDPWRLELFENIEGAMRSAGSGDPDSAAVESRALGLRFSLRSATPRPVVQVAALGPDRVWTA